MTTSREDVRVKASAGHSDTAHYSDETEEDWRTHFGFLGDEAGGEFADAVEGGRERLNDDLADRQRNVVEAFDRNDGT